MYDPIDLYRIDMKNINEPCQLRFCVFFCGHYVPLWQRLPKALAARERKTFAKNTNRTAR